MKEMRTEEKEERGRKKGEKGAPIQGGAVRGSASGGLLLRCFATSAVVQHAHVEAEASTPRDSLADGAQADDADHSAVHLTAEPVGVDLGEGRAADHWRHGKQTESNEHPCDQ